jgi:pyruvate dehydrogenase E1 component alpha subunit
MKNSELLPLVRCMARIRAFEQAAEAASIGGVAALGQQVDPRTKVRGPLHVSIGQEAVAAGVCAHLQREDLLTSSHRGHGHTLAKGADMRRMMAELFGRRDGSNGGKGGSMHIADFSVGMLGANGVVAAGLPIACGAAHALKLQRRPHIVACFFGDGAANRGPFLEALNWACVYTLPVLFVCEDNQWSATTATAALTGGPGIPARAEALGVPASSVDGNDVEAVFGAARTLVAQVRGGAGARLLHARTYRVRGHLSADSQRYRDAADIAHAVAADPLHRARARLLDNGVAPAELETLDAEIAGELAQALEFAEASPPPDAAAAYTDVQTLGAGPWR